MSPTGLGPRGQNKLSDEPQESLTKLCGNITGYLYYIYSLNSLSIPQSKFQMVLISLKCMFIKRECLFWLAFPFYFRIYSMLLCCMVIYHIYFILTLPGKIRLNISHVRHFSILQVRYPIYEPQHDKTKVLTCAPSEESDQPWHPPSLISIFAVRLIGR